MTAAELALMLGLSCDVVMRIFLAICGRGAWGVDDRRGVNDVDLGLVWVGVADGCGLLGCLACTKSDKVRVKRSPI